MTTSYDVPCTNEELEGIALRLVDRGEVEGIRLRLLGGIAVRTLCRDVIAKHPQLDRLCGDIDLAGRSEDTKQIEHVLQMEGFKPCREFNFVNVGSRMLFTTGGLKVDVILDEFRMNHRWFVRTRLSADTTTLPIEDIFLTKLQIVNLTEKDTSDLVILAAKAAGLPVDVCYMKRVSMRSWGMSHTVLKNCRKATHACRRLLGDKNAVELSVFDCLAKAITETRKPLRWRLRNLLGERFRWYEPAEEPRVAYGER